jgi:hypothetical protein
MPIIHNPLAAKLWSKTGLVVVYKRMNAPLPEILTGENSSLKLCEIIRKKHLRKLLMIP